MNKLTITIKKTKDGFTSECPEVNEWCDLGTTWQENLGHLIDDMIETENELMEASNEKLGPEPLKIKKKYISMTYK